MDLKLNIIKLVFIIFLHIKLILISCNVNNVSNDKKMKEKVIEKIHSKFELTEVQQRKIMRILTETEFITKEITSLSEVKLLFLKIFKFIKFTKIEKLIESITYDYPEEIISTEVYKIIHESKINERLVRYSNN